MSMLTYGSVCSGIEAATTAWHPLGWRPAFFSEIEPFPCAVLQHHWPNVPLHGDFTTIQAGEYDPIDILVGGTPCQDFSVAGLRAGMDGKRGQLTSEFAHLAGRLCPRWLVWENVPGVLSANRGRAFGTFLGLLQQFGYGFAYRVLDAQYFGVPQRRRRVFLVGYLGDWRPAAAVLFERHSLQGHPAPGREARKAVAALTADGVGTCGAGDNQAQAGHLIAAIQERAVCENPSAGPDGVGVRTDGLAYTLEARTIPQAVAFGGNNTSGPIDVASAPLVPVAFPARMSGTQCASAEDISPSLGALNPTAVAMNLRGREGGAMAEMAEMASLRAASGGSSRSYVAGSTVRRLTPRECERLQGFPDDFTLVPYRKKMAADGPRYKALGNSMAVPVVKWIGDRIQLVEEIFKESVHGSR